MRLWLLLILFPFLSWSQDCQLVFQGKVIDEHDQSPLAFAHVSFKEVPLFAYTDEQGAFQIPTLCPGDYHLTISHIGCEAQTFHLYFTNDTSITFYLEHHEELLQSITVKENKVFAHKSLATASLVGEQLDNKQGASLGEVLKSLSGVNTLQTGAGISKPMIHGLFGNRIQILNNGVTLQGQQWGNEHAPEIDPFSVQRITVVKGAYALKYGTRAMGGAVLLNSDNMPNNPHLHGAVQWVGMSNGLKAAFAGLLEGGFEKLSALTWRVQASFSKSGDNRSANYYLTNTARQEWSASTQWQFKKKQGTTQLFFTTYQAQMGMLRGSHIGNLSDLEAAFTRDEPFFTADKLTYIIDKPRQVVFHNTLKVNHLQNLSKGTLDISYAFQHNQRKEFDIRRSSEKPSLFLHLQNHDFDLSYKIRKGISHTETGTSFQYKWNANDIGLNVAPLIPNYNNRQIAFFGIQEFNFEKWQLSAGARYENQALLVKYFEKGDLLEVPHHFNNYAANLGIYVPTNVGFIYRSNVSFVSRSPEINELYSQGLHHGAAAIENGNANFTNEKMWSVNQTFTFSKGNVFHLEINPYYQFFYNYINLVAQDELRLTIRGAFPVFQYEAMKAHIWGFDWATQTHFTPMFAWNVKASVVRGQNLENNTPLSFIPADFLENSLQYTLLLPGEMNEMSFGINGRQVWQQVREPAFDFLGSPEGYFLLGAEISGKIQFTKTQLNWQIAGQNLLNTAYRDYLNRWRYFADDLGVNIALRTKLIF